jgi:two-component system nitrogen regulation sensor histidine kinase NtrY
MSDSLSPAVDPHQQWLAEQNKRKRERRWILALALFLILLIWFEIRLFGVASELPFVHSIFFFGLVNFNLVLLLFLLFLAFRNLVKAFAEKKSGLFGSSLRFKLTLAFLSFTTVPTFLIYVTNATYVNASFDKWFSSQMQSIMQASIDLSQHFYFVTKKRNYHVSELLVKELGKAKTSSARVQKMRSFVRQYLLDAVEYYPKWNAERELVMSSEDNIPLIPPVAESLLRQVWDEKRSTSQIENFASGNLVRVIVPSLKPAGLIVISSYVPLSLVGKMNNIHRFMEEYKGAGPMRYPLKSIYSTILVIMSLVIVVAALWFAFYLARQLSTPLIQLGQATQLVAKGEYRPLDIQSGYEEIHHLVESFNQMSEKLSRALKDLDARRRYNDEILRTISTGVLSIDVRGKITTMNPRAAELLRLSAEQWIGRPVRELLRQEYFRKFAELVRMMNEHKVGSIQRELQVNIEGEIKPFLLQLSLLKNDEGEEIGKLAVFDDLTPIINAQRAAAWRDVARRIAHEIKNPLTPIKLSAERILKNYRDRIQDSSFENSVKMIIQQTDELKRLVNEFFQFARLPEIRPSLGSLNQLISERLAWYQSGYPKIDFRLNLDPKLPSFLMDTGQLGQVLTNIVDNAIAAVEKESKPCIEVTTEYLAELNLVRWTIKDNGPGIPGSQRAQVFQPYWTTKSQGSGLGLAISKKIIEDHNGFIRVGENVPRGAQFIIELPVISSRA